MTIGTLIDGEVPVYWTHEDRVALMQERHPKLVTITWTEVAAQLTIKWEELKITDKLRAEMTEVLKFLAESGITPFAVMCANSKGEMEPFHTRGNQDIRDGIDKVLRSILSDDEEFQRKQVAAKRSPQFNPADRE